VVVGAGRCAAPALAVKIAFSLTVGGMAGTLAKKIFSVTPSQTGLPANIYMFCLRGEGQP